MTANSIFCFIPEGEQSVRFPTAHDRGVQAHDQRRRVEKHVKAVRNEAQAVGPHAVEQLDAREEEVEEEKVEDPSRSDVRHHLMQQGSRQGHHGVPGAAEVLASARVQRQAQRGVSDEVCLVASSRDSC